MRALTVGAFAVAVFTGFVVLMPNARAEGVDNTFKPEDWATGVHLLVAGGANTSAFNADATHASFGLGTNFKTDVGYYFTDRLAVEVGSDVEFNWIQGYMLWDTLFTLGVRYRFESPFTHSQATFVRAFYGRAPTVLFLTGAHEAYQNIGASRIQFDGPVVGVGGGRMFQTEKGFVWLVEWDVAFQRLSQQQVVTDQNDVPIVLQSGAVNNNSRIFSVMVNIGCLVF